MYAMSGMSTELHVEATDTGRFNGSSSNISGQGFAGMKFVAESSSASDFHTWLQHVKQSPNSLSLTEYNKLAKPSENSPSPYYGSAQAGLYNDIVLKFMDPAYKIPNDQPLHSHGGED